ncbi:MAG: hydrogenase maturation nickel metallochaperone HypA [Chloroflexota bacterium]
MHELSVTESIVGIVVRHAERAQASRVLRIHLALGELSAIVDDSVQFYFEFVAQGTLAQGAELRFKRIPVELACGHCGQAWHPETADWTCPACQVAQARVVAGREFYVESIEVE